MEAIDRDAAVQGDAADACHMSEGHPPRWKSLDIASAAVNQQAQQRNICRCSDDRTSEPSTSRALNSMQKQEKSRSPHRDSINTIRSHERLVLQETVDYLSEHARQIQMKEAEKSLDVLRQGIEMRVQDLETLRQTVVLREKELETMRHQLEVVRQYKEVWQWYEANTTAHHAAMMHV
ncbi:MAG: hypothetical protein LQ345_003376 [Seirophora villosa]|nr:MAG: hypothetical protein LQ345_003376 [Seirophora villosa]